ncbi:hypothetical protein IAU60_006890 [Kwoniella sp. DSM 27419]
MPLLHISDQAYHSIQRLSDQSTLSDSDRVRVFDDIFPSIPLVPIVAHPLLLSRNEPETVLQCLASWGAPECRVHNTTGPLSTASTNLAPHLQAIFDEDPLLRRTDKKVTVIHDQVNTVGILTWLLRSHLQADDVRDKTTRQAVCDWLVTTRESHSAMTTEGLGYENELDGALRIGLTKAVNHLLRNPHIYKQAGSPKPTGEWGHPDLSVGPGVTDRTLRLGTDTLALQEIKRRAVISHDDFEEIVRAAQQADLATPNGPPQAGFTLTVKDRKVVTDSSQPSIPAEVLLQIWAQAHSNRCRWILLHNTFDSLVFYLRDPATLLVSLVVPGAPASTLRYDSARPAFTLASAMVALSFTGTIASSDGFGWIDTKAQIMAFRKKVRDARDAKKLEKVQQVSKKRKASDDDVDEGGSGSGGRAGPDREPPRDPDDTHDQGSGRWGGTAGGRDDDRGGRKRDEPQESTDTYQHSRETDLDTEKTESFVMMADDHQFMAAHNAALDRRGVLHYSKESCFPPVRLRLSHSQRELDLQTARFACETGNMKGQTLSFLSAKQEKPHPGFISVRVGNHVGTGHLWTVYEAQLWASDSFLTPDRPATIPSAHSPASHLHSSPVPSLSSSTATGSDSTSPRTPTFERQAKSVVIKLVDPYTLSEWLSDLDHNDAQRAVRTEADMYNGPLRALYGTVVSQFYGLWRTPDGTYMMILERLRDPIALGSGDEGRKPRWSAISPLNRLLVLELYVKLHQAGVVHGDLTPRHILGRDPEGPEQPALIDFDCAKQVDPHGPEIRKERQELGELMDVSPWWPGWKLDGPAW